MKDSVLVADEKVIKGIDDELHDRCAHILLQNYEKLFMSGPDDTNSLVAGEIFRADINDAKNNYMVRVLRDGNLDSTGLFIHTLRKAKETFQTELTGVTTVVISAEKPMDATSIMDAAYLIQIECPDVTVIVDEGSIDAGSIPGKISAGVLSRFINKK